MYLPSSVEIVLGRRNRIYLQIFVLIIGSLFVQEQVLRRGCAIPEQKTRMIALHFRPKI